MARRGWSTSNYALHSTGIVTAAPLTMACWGKTSITGATQTLFALNNSASAPDRNDFLFGIGSTQQLYVGTGDGGAATYALSANIISANTWFHACARYASATSREAILNGGTPVINTTSRTPSGINRLTLGVLNGSSFSSPFAPAGNGDLAEVAIWNVALSDEEVINLSEGVSPQMIRPSSLVFYAPLVRELVDIMGNPLSTIGSLSVSDHCRIINPS